MTTEIIWSDLTFEKQEELISIYSSILYEEAEVEGKRSLTKKWDNPIPETWQEAYCRLYDISYELWNDYISNIEMGLLSDEIEPPTHQDWVYWLQEHIREEAEEKCKMAFRHIEVTI